MEDDEIVIGIKTNNKKSNSLSKNDLNPNNKVKTMHKSNSAKNSRNNKKSSMNLNNTGKHGLNKKAQSNNNEKQTSNIKKDVSNNKSDKKKAINTNTQKKEKDNNQNINKSSEKIKKINSNTEKNNNLSKHKFFKKLNTKSRISLAIKNSKSDEEKHNMKIKIIALSFIFLIFIVLLFSSNIFSIKNIIVNDNNILSDETIISFSGIEKYTNIFRFNKISIINNIESNAYIEKAKIKRWLPSTIEITVKERIPTFMLQFADSYVYINNQGYILEISNEKRNIPILTGSTTDLVNMKAGLRINEDDLKKMNTVIKIYEIAKSNELGDLITKIDISNPKNYTLFLESEGKIVYLGDCEDSDLNTKMLYLKSIIDASQGRPGEVFLNIDLNSQNVYVRWSTE